MAKITIELDTDKHGHILPGLLAQLSGSVATIAPGAGSGTAPLPPVGGVAPPAVALVMPTMPPAQSDVGDDDGDASPASTATHDTSGMPWDARIHSAKRQTNSDGSWRRRRGVADSFVAEIEAQLRAGAAAPIPQNIPAAPLPPPPTMPPNVGTLPPAAPPPPVLQPPVNVPTPHQPVMDFAGFMTKLTQLMATDHPNGGKYVTAEWLKWLTDGMGMTNITELATQPHFINKAITELQTHGRWV